MDALDLQSRWASFRCIATVIGEINIERERVLLCVHQVSNCLGVLYTSTILYTQITGVYNVLKCVYMYIYVCYFLV